MVGHHGRAEVQARPRLESTTRCLKYDAEKDVTVLFQLEPPLSSKLAPLHHGDAQVEDQDRTGGDTR